MDNFSNNPNEEVLQILQKRRNIYTIVFVVLLVIGGVTGVIPILGFYISTAVLIFCGIFAGFGMLCINTYRVTKSNGRKQGGGLWWLLLFVFGLIVIPLITVFILNHAKTLAEKVLGVRLE